jgi:hypothetical protein
VDLVIRHPEINGKLIEQDIRQQAIEDLVIRDPGINRTGHQTTGNSGP